MNSDKIFEDIVIWKKRELSVLERKQIIQDILVYQAELPFSSRKITQELLNKFSDHDLVWLFSTAQFYDAIKFFKENQKPLEFYIFFM